VSVLLAATLAAAVQGSFTVGDRTEQRLRNEPSGDGNRFVADIETSPLAALKLWSRRAEVGLSYTPRYTLRDYGKDPTAEILQRMGLSVGGNDRFVRFVVGEDFAYGRTSFATLGLGQSATTTTAAPGAPPIERLPLVQTIQFISSRTYFATSIIASRLVRYGAYADFSYGGGTDTASKSELPLQTSPRGELSLDVTVGRRDALVTTLRGSKVLFEAGARVPAIDITLFEQLQGVRHRFARTTEGTFSIGVSETALRVEHGPAQWKVYPIAEAMLRHLAPDHIEARAYARFAPIVDRLTGNLTYQLQSSLVGLWTIDTPRHGYVARTLLGFAQTLPPLKDQAITVVLLEAALGYRTSEHVLFEVGARAINQRVFGSDPTPLFYVGFVSATVTSSAMRF
jgi:hypothetical protein